MDRSTHLFRLFKVFQLMLVAVLVSTLALNVQQPVTTVQAAGTTITVNSRLDGDPADDGLCTLREAIMAANDNKASGSTEGECAAGSSSEADTIDLEIGGTLTLSSALPAITEDVTIQGPGAPYLIISGDDQYRVFTIESDNKSIEVALFNVTISKGRADNQGGALYNRTNAKLTLASSTVYSSTAGMQGGGIYNDGTLVISDTTVYSNTTFGQGGGIYNAGTLDVVEQSSIVTNTLTRPAGSSITGEGKLIGPDGEELSLHGGGIYNAGSATIQSSTISGNVSGKVETFQERGGGIYNVNTLEVNNAIFAENTAFQGGALYTTNNSTTEVRQTIIAETLFHDNHAGFGDNGIGGAIMNLSNGNVDAQIYVQHCTFTSNLAGFGAAIENRSQATITDSLFEANVAKFYGGGIRNNATNGSRDTDIHVYNSTFSANIAGGEDNLKGNGGGVSNAQGSVAEIVNSTFYANISRGVGGAIYNGETIIKEDSASYEDNTLTILNSTIYKNEAAKGGGGIYTSGGLDGMDSDGNYHLGTTTTVFSNTIIGGNKSTDGNDDCVEDGTRKEVSSGGYNLLTDGNGCPADGTTDQTNFSADDDLDTTNNLDDNGGPTNTIALSVGSNALDKIANGTNGCGTDPLDEDQRGEDRPYGATNECDIGAYEDGREVYGLTVDVVTESDGNESGGTVYREGVYTPYDINCQDNEPDADGPRCSKNYLDGDTVNLVVKPNPGYTFSGWTGDCSGKNEQFSLNMDKAKSCTATFRNSPPVLQTDVDLTLEAIDEDEQDSDGTLVVDMLASGTDNDIITDEDVGAIEGIAVVSVDNDNGSWQYSTDGGKTWNDFGTPSESEARLLASDAATTLIRFVPDENFNGTAEIEFRAWDQTSGENGGTADLSSLDENSAFSTETQKAVATITVNAVNDAPVLDTAGTPTLTSVKTGDQDSSGDSVADIVVDGSITDDDTDTPAEAIAVTSVDNTNGTWQYYDPDAGEWQAVSATSGQVVDMASGSLLLDSTDQLRFVPDADFENDATFTFRAWDKSDGSEPRTTADTSTNGGTTAFSAEEETATVTVSGDTDGDGVLDADEDLNDNGNNEDDNTDRDDDANYKDTDDDGDGILTKYEDLNGDGDPTNDDTDGDGTPNYLDTDDDNDGIDTAKESPDPNGDGNPADAKDSDDNGIPDYLDPEGDSDPDGDGLYTQYECPNGLPCPDTDGNGTPDYMDADDDGDGTPTADEQRDPNGDGDPADAVDSDNNGIPDYLDPGNNDPDGDGIYTEYECPNGLPCPDTDGNGTPDYMDPDDDGDGLLTANENPDPDGNHDPADANDADDDGIPDYLEAGDNANNPDDDADGDGISSADECPDGAPCRDTDGDGRPDYMDADDDGDGILTKHEDPNGDGDPTNDNTDGDDNPNYLDPDDDGDGNATEDENADPNGDGDPADAADADEDGVPDYLEPGDNKNTKDDDGDGVPTSQEDLDGDGNPLNDDTDGDGKPNYADDDDDGDGILSKHEDLDGDGDPSNDNTDGDDNPNYLDADDDGDETATKDENPDPNGDGDPADAEDADEDGVPDYLEPGDNANNPDDDGDGVPTSQEDLDGDGNPLNDDTDGDGKPNYADDDDDGDGILSKHEDLDGDGDPSNDNTDGDDNPNYLDADDDGDETATKDENPDPNGDGDPADAEDADEDGVPDYLEPGDNANNPDDDGDGVPTSQEDLDGDGNPLNDDTDGDGKPNYADDDDDGDGILSKHEDLDGDGDPTNDNTDGDDNPNYLSPDDDGDGDATKDENADPNGDGDPADAEDTDGDGIPNYLEPGDNANNPDDDGDTIPTQVECPDGMPCPDTDEDGTPDYLDTDSDNDGIPDSVEVGDDPNNPVDTDGDGTPDYLDTDSDNDGIPDSVEAGNDPNNPVDTDGDGIPDYLDTDSDNDGTPDAEEVGDEPSDPIDTDNDGVPDYQEADDGSRGEEGDEDGDGVPTDVEDRNGDGDPSNDDTDGDGIPDYLDGDDDGDGVPTQKEDVNGDGDPTNDDSDGDGIPNYLDDDDDNDNVKTIDEDVDGDGDPTNDDTDKDGTPDYLDTDDDGDGTLTRTEDVDGDGDPMNDDTDKDGTPNYLDPDDTLANLQAMGGMASMVYAPEPGMVGQPLTYTVRITNTSAADAQVSFADTLPATMTLSYVLPGQGDCTVNDNVISCDMATVKSGQNVTATIVVTPTHSGTYTNSMVVAGIGNNPVEVHRPTTVVAAQGADLQIVNVLDTPDPVMLGGELSYVVDIRNTGTNAATNVQLHGSFTNEISSESIPKLVTDPATFTGENCTPDGNMFTCDLGAIAASDTQTKTVTLAFTAPDEEGQIDALFVVQGNESDLNLSNNEARVDTQVERWRMYLPYVGR